MARNNEPTRAHNQWSVDGELAINVCDRVHEAVQSTIGESSSNNIAICKNVHYITTHECYFRLCLQLTT